MVSCSARSITLRRKSSSEHLSWAKKLSGSMRRASSLLPKVKLEIVLPDALAENAVATILNTAKTGKIGDGKIFLSKVDDAIRVRNGDRGDTVL